MWSRILRQLAPVDAIPIERVLVYFFSCFLMHKDSAWIAFSRIITGRWNSARGLQDREGGFLVMITAGDARRPTKRMKILACISRVSLASPHADCSVAKDIM
jgi:hypothetical protein